ncbi:NEM1 [Candida margitis]|uniref:NEM1 n=1 Tax=Candida margitis TaxID=1775924 RepID=UPI002226248D|nr:NEM1 [Candida margitis]KAI5969999.1 NEM1 [Candida margitis]
MNSIKLIVNSFDNILPGKGNYDIPPTNDDGDDQRSGKETEQEQEQVMSVNDDDGKTLEDPNAIKGPCRLPATREETPTISLEEKVEQNEELEDVEEGEEEEEEEEEEEVNLTTESEKHVPTPSQTSAYKRSSIVVFFIQVGKVIYFFPNYLIIKPISIIINLIIFPFVLLKISLGFGPKPARTKQDLTYDDKIDTSFDSDVADSLVTRATPPSSPATASSSSSSSPASKSKSTHLDSDPDEYDEKIVEQIKQENLLANEVKSPSSFSRYMIPPPQRLFPLSRNPQRKRRKKILILDLDETLIHSLSRGGPRTFNPASKSKMIEIKLNNVSSLYYVHKRPYCDYFLTQISQWFELQIFTASVKEYADPIIDWLEEEIIDSLRKKGKRHKIQSSSDYIKPHIFTKRYYRSDCSYRPGVGYIKDLSRYLRDDELKNVMILDNSPISYAMHEDNAIGIEGWINDSNDRDLLNLLPLLKSLSLCIDVRFILGLKNGEKLFEM